MRIRIPIRTEGAGDSLSARPLLRRAIRETLRAEGIETDCQVDVLLTDDARIRDLNRRFRDVDSSTDVLSFPLQALAPGAFDPAVCDADPETGFIPLGDMVLNVQRAREQAREYGHSTRREIAYLAVHSTLHLLGYDHVDEGAEKRRMRAREEFILGRMGIGR